LTGSNQFSLTEICLHLQISEQTTRNLQDDIGWKNDEFDLYKITVTNFFLNQYFNYLPENRSMSLSSLNESFGLLFVSRKPVCFSGKLFTFSFLAGFLLFDSKLFVLLMQER
jgi:hypothetical protein